MSVGPSPNDTFELETISQNESSTTKKKSGYWTRITKKWKRRGVVEIDADHHRYNLLNCIRLGLKEIHQKQYGHGPKVELLPSDYTDVLETTIQTETGQSFQFTSYASSVFATIRQATGLLEEDYISSMTTSNPYFEFVSTSHGGQHFYLTHDKAFFMKTEKKYYFNYFSSILRFIQETVHVDPSVVDYLDHFLRYPHSLLVKYLGLFSIKLPGRKKLYLYAMQSIFFPQERIELRYDLKGCLAGRCEKDADPKADVIPVYKDQNFLGRTINLGCQRDWFLEQLQHDVRFLVKLGVQDYSLLVGMQNIHEDELSQDFGDVVERVRKSIAHSSPTIGHMIYRVVEEEEDKDTDPSDPDHQKDMPSPMRNGWKGSKRRGLTKRPISFVDQLAMSEIEKKNLRLLPKCKNSLHVIDGPDTRYYLGIIDFFTLYECRQRTAKVLKDIRHCCGDHSTVPPAVYARRFLNFVTEHTT